MLAKYWTGRAPDGMRRKKCCTALYCKKRSPKHAMGSPSGSAPGTFKYEVEFVSDDEDDARDDDDVVRAEIHFHDVLTEEYASYGVKLPAPWLRKATARDLVDAFADEYARTRPERGAMGRLRLVTTRGAALEPSAALDGVVRGGAMLGEMAKRFGAADKRDGSGKQLQELTNTILAVIEKPPTMGGDKGGLQVFSWMLLFAQLVGFHTLSSRLVALPERAAVYVLDVIDKCRPLLDGKLPTNELRDCMAAKENEAMVGYIKVDKARVLMATLLKNAPFDTESAAFGQAMESAFRSIVLHIANTPCVEMAEFLTLVAAGFVATQCPTLVNEG